MKTATSLRSDELIIKLLAEELRSAKLFDTLEAIGWGECFYRPDLGDVIQTLLYGKDRPEAMQDFYFTVISRYSAWLEPGRYSAEYYAHMAYGELVSFRDHCQEA